MKNIKKVVALCLALCLCVLSACSSSDSLSGRWRKTDGTAEFSYIEFFSDGTYTTNDANYEGDYSIDGDRIRLSGVLVSPLAYTYQVSGDTLTFLSGDRVLATFEKIS